jgi:hypothetical protein
MKHHSTYDETGLSAAAIATNVSVKDFYVLIMGNDINMVAPCKNQRC